MDIEHYQPTPITPAVGELSFTVVPAQAAQLQPMAAGRQLVQLEDGQWVLAKVPPAPPVILPAPPQAVARRGLSNIERTAVIVVGSVCALTLSTGGALAMAGPYLVEAGHFAIAVSVLLGAVTAAWLALRLTVGSRGVRPALEEPRPTIQVTNNVTVNNNALLSRGKAVGIEHVDRIG